MRSVDLGRVDEDGYIRVEDGRTISPSARVPPTGPTKVGESLSKPDPIVEAVVVGYSDNRRGEVVTAAIVFGSGNDRHRTSKRRSSIA